MSKLQIDTTSLTKDRGSVAVTYQEAYEELVAAYDQSVGLETGYYHVGLSDTENPAIGSLYNQWYEIYLQDGIGEIFHIDIDTWLARPRWRMMLMLTQARKYNARRIKSMEGVAGNFNDIENNAAKK